VAVLIGLAVGAWYLVTLEAPPQVDVASARPDAALPPTVAVPEPPKVEELAPAEDVGVVAQPEEVDTGADAPVPGDDEISIAETEASADAGTPDAAAPGADADEFHLVTVPDGATIFRAGKELGTTPMALTLKRATTVILKRAGYKDVRLKLNPEKPERNISIELKARPIGDPAAEPGDQGGTDDAPAADDSADPPVEDDGGAAQPADDVPKDAPAEDPPTTPPADAPKAPPVDAPKAPPADVPKPDPAPTE
jgi:hypothetical protein